MINELELQNEVEKIKQHFTQTQAIYREVCMLMFFRYGVTPTANKLYQYVRKGSMSAPAEALQKFWLELREKSRVQLDHPDLPEQLKSIGGELISTIWGEAQKAAQENFSVLAKQSSDEAANHQMAAKVAQDALAKSQVALESAVNENETLTLQIEMLNKTLDHQTHLISSKDNELANKTLAYQTLKKEHEQLANSILEMKASFSRDLATYTHALNKAEDRYSALEKKTLLEIDHNRQLALQHQKALIETKRAHEQIVRSLSKEKGLHDKKLLSMQEKLSLVSGRYAEASKQLRTTNAEMKKLRVRVEQLTKKLNNKT